MRDKDLNSISGIYSFTNLINGKQYIGSAHSLFIRAKQHFYYLSVGRHANIHLQRSYDKNGKFAFEFKILAICSRKDLLFYEQRFIDALKPQYNICKVAGSAAGRKKTPEQRARIAEIVRLQWANDPGRRKRQSETRGKRKHTEESKALISQRSKEMWANPEIRKKLMDNQYRPSQHKKSTSN